MEDPLAITVPDMEEGEVPLGISCSPTPPSSSTTTTTSSLGNGLLPLPSPYSTSSIPYHPRAVAARPDAKAASRPPRGPSTSFSSKGSSSLMMEDSPPLRQFTWTDFDIIQKVGEGTTGSVYKANFRGTETLYALKVFRHEADMGVSISALQEIKSFQRLRPLKYIVRLIGFAFTPKEEFVLVEEYMEHDLAGLMHSKRRFTEPHIKCIMHQLLSGLHECHQMQLIHRDVKSSNILMHKGNLRITDFGFMTTLENAARYQSCEIITLWYRPPELLLGTTTYGQEVDMWSAGCIFFELLTGEIAFRGRSSKDQLVLLFKTLGKPSEATWPSVSSLPLWGETRDVPPYPNALRERLVGSRASAQALDLLASLLALDPKKRPTTAQALAHPFFTHGAAPCQPSELPHWSEAHEYELKKAQQQGSTTTTTTTIHNSFRNGGGGGGHRGPASGGPGQSRIGGGVSGHQGTNRRVPPTHPSHHHHQQQQHPYGGRPGQRGRMGGDGILSHHHHTPSQQGREEVRKRPADVDWILNREKPSVKPPGGPTSPPAPAPAPSARGPHHHDAKRLRPDLASPLPPSSSSSSSSSIPRKRESSLPPSTGGSSSAGRSDEERTPRHRREDPSAASSAGTAATTPTPPTKAKLIQPLRRSSPTRARLPAVPMSSLPVRRDSGQSSQASRSPPLPTPSAPTPTSSSKITIRRSKVGDKALLRIVTPGAGSPPAPASARSTTDVPPTTDAYREGKKRRQPSPAEGDSRQAGAAAGQGHPRKVQRRAPDSATLHSSSSSPSSSSLSPPDANGDGLLPTPPAPSAALQQQQRRQRAGAPAQKAASSARKGAPAHGGKSEGQRAAQLYCTCRQPNDPSRWMIACDWCDSWYHGECEGVTQEEGDRMPKYKCRRCRGLVSKDE